MPRRPNANILALAALAALLTAPADAGELQLEDHTLHIEATSESGRWRVRDPRSDATLLTLEVPLGLKPRGDFALRSAPLDDTTHALLLDFTPTDGGSAHRFVFAAPSHTLDARAELLWSGPPDPARSAVYVELVDVDTDPALVRRHTNPAFPSCGLITTAPPDERYDPSSRRFQPLPRDRPELGQRIAAQLDLASLQLPELLASRTLRAQAASSTRARAGARGIDARPDALTDDDLTTSWAPHPDDPDRLAILRLNPDLGPTDLLLIPADEATSLDGLELYADTGPQGALSVPFPGPLRVTWDAPSPCLALRLPPGVALAEVSLRTRSDRDTLDAALSALFRRVVESEDRALRQRLTLALLAFPDALAPSLDAWLQEADADPGRALEIIPQLPPRLRITLLARVALHPDTSADTLLQIEDHFATHPERSAAAIGALAEGLPPEHRDYRRAAYLIAPLPVEGRLKPLLKALDRASLDGDDARPLFERLVEVGPPIVEPLFAFASAPTDAMRDTTRVLLLRALLEVAPAWRAAHPDLEIEPRPGLLALLQPEHTASLRALLIRVLDAYLITHAYPILESLLASDPIDVIRAESATAIARLHLEPTSENLLRALREDASPTVRIAAARALATDALAPREEVYEALRDAIDEARWPEVQRAALLGLARANHPDALELAEAWLETRDGDDQDAAVTALTLLPNALTWDRTRRILDDVDISAAHARLALSLFIEDAEPAALAPVDAWLRDPPEATSEDALLRHERLTDIGIAALDRRDYDAIVPLLLYVMDTHAGTELAVTAIELAGAHDTSEIRARLQALSQSEHERSALQARESLLRLDGVEPTLDDPGFELP